MAFILGPSSPAVSFLQEVPRHFDIRNGAILTGWARTSGVGQILRALGESLSHVDIVVGMAGSATSAEALSHLVSLSRRVFVYHKHHRQTFHPKLYLLDDGCEPPANARLLVGSSNLTGGGLFQNIEGNFATILHPSSRADDRAIYESVMTAVNELINSPFSEQIHDDTRLLELLRDQYIRTEDHLIRARLVESRDAARHGQRRRTPEAPPPPLPPAPLPPLETNFNAGVVEIGSAPTPALDLSPIETDTTEQFYVRTLTQNDVNKLRGQTPGTAEWDIGVTARDAMPEFWGWPQEYARIERQQVRQEWTTSGILRSASTSIDGTDVEIVVWYRAERPGHAAEHRLQIRPRGRLIEALPPGFDISSLVVLERLPLLKPQTFLVRLLTRYDPEYSDFVRYLTNQRPQHRYGYGP